MTSPPKLLLNLVALSGTLDRPAQLRTLKNGGGVVGFDLRIASRSSRSEVLRVSWFDAPDSTLSLEPGTAITVIGRMRRFWFAGPQSITDVVAEKVVIGSSATRNRKALAEAMARLQEVCP